MRNDVKSNTAQKAAPDDAPMAQVGRAKLTREQLAAQMEMALRYFEETPDWSLNKRWKERFLAVSEKIRPEPLIGAVEAATLAGVSTTRLAKLASEEYFPPCVMSKYQERPFYRGFIRYLKDRLTRKGETVQDIDRKIKEQKSKLLDIELEAAVGKRMLTSDHHQVLENIVLIFRERALSIPGKAATRLPFCKSEKEMQELLQKEIDDLLLALANPENYNASNQI